jgi:hypothetical protein
MCAFVAGATDRIITSYTSDSVPTRVQDFNDATSVLTGLISVSPEPFFLTDNKSLFTQEVILISNSE